MHHFHTQPLTVITDSLFQGEKYHSPIYNSDTAASGLIKFVGTVIVHSIVQRGPGLPVFSPGIHYLAKGNVEEAMKSLTEIDCSLEFISKVSNNQQYQHDTTYFPNQTEKNTDIWHTVAAGVEDPVSFAK